MIVLDERHLKRILRKYVNYYHSFHATPVEPAEGATVAGDNLRGTAVVVENAQKSLSRHDGASVIRACRQRCEELVAETLVVPFCVIVHYVFGYRCAQVSLTERYEAVETLSTYGENESFRICVQIRTISGKAKGLHA